jgi:hypothetical protein
MNKFLAYSGQALLEVDSIKDPSEFEPSTKITTERSLLQPPQIMIKKPKRQLGETIYHKKYVTI